MTTAITPNRIRDKRELENRGLREEGNNHISFYTKRNTLVAIGYVRVVYGDHGPYIEFNSSNMIRTAWKRGRIKSSKAYYDECWSKDEAGCKLYVQKRSVVNLPNPPKGKYSVNNNRPEGYADYKVGMLYISPYDVQW